MALVDDPSKSPMNWWDLLVRCWLIGGMCYANTRLFEERVSGGALMRKPRSGSGSCTAGFWVGCGVSRRFLWLLWRLLVPRRGLGRRGPLRGFGLRLRGSLLRVGFRSSGWCRRRRGRRRGGCLGIRTVCRLIGHRRRGVRRRLGVLRCRSGRLVLGLVGLRWRGWRGFRGFLFGVHRGLGRRRGMVGTRLPRTRGRRLCLGWRLGR